MAQRLGVSTHVRYSPTSDAPPAPRPRATRGFHVAMAVLMTGIVIAGFWPTYFGQVFSGTLDRPWIIHVHGLVFLGWMALLITQVALVFGGRRDLHRKLGRVGIGYGALVLGLGLVITVAAPVMHVVAGDWTPDRAASFLILPLGDMVLFATLFGAAIGYRRRPEVHKRLMVLATVALLFAPAARIAGASGPAVLLPIWLAPVAIAMAHDVWSRRRVHGAYIAGTVFLLVGFLRVLVRDSPEWLRMGHAILGVFLPDVTGGG